MFSFNSLQCWQWPLGSFIVTTAWLNFLLQLRLVGHFGIFILMLNNVIKTVARFSVIVAVFVIAFGCGFHILFINQVRQKIFPPLENLYFQLAFDSIAGALLKTFVMMIGEYDFEGIFTEHYDPEKNMTENAESARNNPFPAYSSLVFVAFIFVMTIIIMNMMVGLAVDDIVEIQNNAQFSKLCLNVSFFSYCSQCLSSFSF